MQDKSHKENEGSVSLNKYLSSKGLCSRREADKWIEQGRVRINGEKAVKGNRVWPKDRVSLDGKEITIDVPTVYIMLNKPPGITCTTDLRDKSNIIDFINFNQRIFPIGRLDKNSSGLILLTNDGDIVNKILRKENRHEKEYIVTVDRPVTRSFLERMSRPIPMLGTKTLPCKVTQLKAKVFRIILIQGLNRQIRRMVEYCGYKVLSLKRVRIMDLKMGKLEPGEWRYLTPKEITLLTNKLP
jgi:23S rRNA pseudouridine2604 synthase